MSDGDDERPLAGPPMGPELERRLRDALARHESARAESARAESAGDDAPSPEALLDALAGRLPEEERVRLIDRAARTAEGRRELATLRVALGAAESAWPESGSAPERRSHEPHASPPSTGAGRRASWWLRPATAAAAALLLATGLGGGMWWRMMHASPNAAADPLRSGGEGARVALVAAEVDATAAAPPTLAWRAVPGALGYDVEVLTPQGAVVHAASTRDTTLALPAAAVPAAGAAYEWWVRARTAEGARRSAVGRIRGR